MIATVNLQTIYVGIFIEYLCTKFNMPRCSGPLITAMKQITSATLLLTKNYFNKCCTFFDYILSYIEQHYFCFQFTHLSIRHVVISNCRKL
jgi:hypothetical protein